jgi:predicted dehydrogenase
MQPVNRRQFITRAAASSLAFPYVSRSANANAQLQHAAIGVTNQGASDLGALYSHPKFKLVAICDVDMARLGQAAAKYPEARTYTDWRELLEKEGDNIDSVNVTVPDHMHAPISISAMQRGKHVYCEKPLTHEVAEARRMATVAKKTGVITQMGNQIHSHIAYRMGVAWIQQGVIGKIKEVHSWSGARFPQAAAPATADPIPDTLNWENWLGVAPERAFNNSIYHPFNWRGWQDFGGGAIGDFGCHILDPVFSALQLTAPTEITCTDVEEAWKDTPARFTDSWPGNETFKYIFPGTAYTVNDTLEVTWYDGTSKPARELAPLPEGHNLPGGGSIFIGENGVMVLPHVGGPQLLPKEKFAGTPKPDIPKHISHYHTYIDHCISGELTSDGFHYAGPLTEAVLLGNIAVRHPGEKLMWNAADLTISNNAEANKLVSRPYRKGWEV